MYTYLCQSFIHSFIHYVQFIPTLVVFALPSTMPHTIMSVQCRTQCSDITISSRFQNFVEIMMSEHCVRNCTLIMVCGIVLGKAKTTKVGMVWYELNIVN